MDRMESLVCVKCGRRRLKCPGRATCYKTFMVCVPSMLPAAIMLLLLPAAKAAPEADEIKKMPGWSKPLPSKQFSGFIHVPNGPGGQDIHMHYNFIESQGSPTSDPLTLWQQGGPGSSGFGFGYMAELGPFHLSDESMANAGADGIPALWQNPYSWDTLSNVLILEHPPGTGFSYCADPNGTVVTCKWNDETQAEAFLMEIEGWFELFPEYKDHEFYLTGESYAGLLLPNLMNQIATKPNSINLKAAAIGNGCTGTPGQSIEKPGTCNLGGDFDQQHNLDLFYVSASHVTTP
jgi:serine carboxypeptidase-like clade I